MLRLVLVLLCFTTICSTEENMTHLNAKCSSSLLKTLLRNYDKKVVPKIDGKPVEVTVQMAIKDMVPIESIHMHYSMDMYFRLYWTDPRLAFENFTPPCSNLSRGMLAPIAFAEGIYKHIWSPDIFFPNGKKGRIHQVTKPNRLLRLDRTGYIFSSRRITVTPFCSMDLHNFPFDKQMCEFTMLSFGYDSTHMRINWNNASGGPIFAPVDKNMLEYTLAGITHNRTVVNYNVAGHIDTLIVTFYLTRNKHYYFLQMYSPCILIVTLSWIGFWIDYRSTPARVTLGITTVLTMATLGDSIRAALPPASYTKALDIYVSMAFCYVFFALIEYAIVGITDIRWKEKITRASSKKRRRKRLFDRQKVSTNSRTSIISMNDTTTRYRNDSFVIEETEISNFEMNNNTKQMPRPVRKHVLTPNFDFEQQNELENLHKERLKKQNISKMGKTKRIISNKIFEKQLENLESHVIDRTSRYVFPIMFIISNICYFAYYLTR
ncbi:glycine receptor subunit alpha-4-like [Hydractinia symbiolongicarpus]|uniref:glycine receptor subunit alpha-4-like n=1 Tax=Hydractinia symbiolongicarpus TaxID=13093 RepID=UPI00254F31D1|nr:glycine receptor subunit alpha-4-like [Hydractinia symbiolongicarpus]